MTPIKIPEMLHREVVAANESLKSAPDREQFKAAAQVAQRLIGFYQQRVPVMFADHTAEFYRERKHALQAGTDSDACASLLGWRNHAHSIETEAPTPVNIAWLQRIFGTALDGKLHLRAEVLES
jgi:hypothetical protein